MGVIWDAINSVGSAAPSLECPFWLHGVSFSAYNHAKRLSFLAMLSSLSLFLSVHFLFAGLSSKGHFHIHTWYSSFPTDQLSFSMTYLHFKNLPSRHNSVGRASAWSHIVRQWHARQTPVSSHQCLFASTWIRMVWLPCWPPRGQQVSHQRWIWDESDIKYYTHFPNVYDFLEKSVWHRERLLVCKCDWIKVA